jgi:hypothetical protein
MENESSVFIDEEYFLRNIWMQFKRKILEFKERLFKYIQVMIESLQVRACVVMTLGLCSTFIGYEYARAASITLLADEVLEFKAFIM